MKYLRQFISLSFIIFISSCDSQTNSCNELGNTIKKDNILLTSIDTLSLDQAHHFLKEQQEGVSLLLKFSKTNLEFSIGTEDTTYRKEAIFDDFSDPILPNDTLATRLNRFFSKLFIRQQIEYSSSYVSMDIYSLNMDIVKEYWNDPQNMPSIQIEKVFNTDKTISKDTIGFDKVSYRELGVTIPSSKYIDSIQVNITYTYPIIEEIILEHKNTRTKLPTGTIALENKMENTILLSYPNSIREKIIAVKGVHKSEKNLKHIGSSSNTRPSEEMLSYLECFNNTLKTTIKQIDSKKIKSKEALGNFLLKNTPTSPKNEQVTLSKYQFSGNVQKVKVYIQTGVSTKVKETYIVKRSKRDQKPKINYFLAVDKEKEKMGFVNEKGGWVIFPEFEDLRMANDYYYHGKHKEDLNQTYWLDTNNNILKLVDYKLDEYEVFPENLVNIEKKTNGPEGVINAKTGHIIIPMKYDYIRPVNGFFITDLNNQEELYDKKGRKVLNKTFSSIQIKGNLVFTSINTDMYYDKKDIYTLQGKNITNGKWNDFEDVSGKNGFGKDGLLLVYKKSSENNFMQVKNKAFINKEGKVIIDLNSYKEAKSFSNGLAAVRNNDTGLWGYINSNGKIVIPFLYENARYFMEKYACVEKNETAFLIDKNNKIFKQFSDNIQSSSITIDTNEAEYHLYNEESYDAEGNLIKGKESSNN
ncbi:WG repeat-containing protein [Aquimarina aquimarini]|uniref:WG repeat-containing protein n=1 Tax=Aquimarina aquimarini TaxID=1191734 RepID=UPI000D5593E8|nr:WG repeat-containing protein [Aquimarina aquimarini]